MIVYLIIVSLIALPHGLVHSLPRRRLVTTAKTPSIALKKITYV